jgi:hypothetical protein
MHSKTNFQGLGLVITNAVRLSERCLIRLLGIMLGRLMAETKPDAIQAFQQILEANVMFGAKLWQGE